jgi:hypothetical protein
MTVRTCDTCGATDDSIAIIRWRPQEQYLYLDYCPKCLKEKKLKYRKDGYTKEDGYDV